LEKQNIFVPQVTRIANRMFVKHGHQVAETPIKLDEGVRAFESYAARSMEKLNGHSGAAEPVETFAAEIVARFDNVSHYYELMEGEQRQVLKNINLGFGRGERIALVGANGAGKSTLLKMISGLERPRHGRVLLLGRDIIKDSPEKLSEEVALVCQDPQEMFIEDSVRGDIAYFLKERRIKDREHIVEQALQDFNLVELQERDARLLSGGQMRRASLAIGACMRPRIMLLDEPTSSLDVSNRSQIIKMLSQLQNWVETVIIATHDMELVAEWATRMIVMSAGQVLADASPSAVFGDPELINKSRIYPPQVVRLSNALAITPVHLSVETMVEFLAAG